MPTAFATTRGFVNGENASVVSGTTSFTGRPTTSHPARNYRVTPVTSGRTTTNYDFTAVSSNIRIHAKILDVLVRWGSKPMSVLGLNRDLPLFNINAIEVKFTDPIEISGGGPALTSTAGGAPSASGSNLGTYDQTWTLPSAIGVDRLLADLQAPVPAAFVARRRNSASR